MEKQPAYTNYFFKGGYVELGRTLANAFTRCGEDIADSWGLLCDAFFDLGNLKHIWYAFLWCITFGNSDTASLEFEWSGFFYSFWALIKFCFALFKLLCVAVLTSVTTCLFSGVHIIILMTFFLIAYLFFGVIKLADVLYCGAKHISTSCPKCQKRYSLPAYVCKCGRKHTRMVPSKYGIFKRTCLCGAKLSTTFFNGRHKMPGKYICPNANCGYDFGGGDKILSTSIAIPVVAGPSAGKTCYITMALSQLSKTAGGLGLDFAYQENVALGDDYKANIARIERCELPPKTQDKRMRYYQFDLTPKGDKIRNIISICDVAGEAYESSADTGAQQGFKYADAFLMLVDPLSLEDYRKEVTETEGEAAVTKYGASMRAMDEVATTLVNALINMKCISQASMVNTDVAVVFTKCDIPGLDEKIGKKAVATYMANNPKATRFEAQNKVCEQFLLTYGGMNFLQGLTAQFKSIQFFTCSALGHSKDGQAFVAEGVEEPILWLIDKESDRIDLKDKWGKSI
ncbi:MAG: hypothetical protein IJX87_02755 [Clostridia bacterium]|nr:hypothetical protein [Clostridia bacterium]